MLKNSPLVSVIIPTFNGSRTVLSTLSSVFRQDYTFIELIVVDDGSSDSTSSLVRDFVAKSNFRGTFVLVQHDKNVGLSLTLNDGLGRAQGAYVLILHQDCEFMIDTYISKAITLMYNNQVAIVTGYYGVSDPEDDTFVKRAFGVLRRQFHARPEVSCEEVTFSEGKCD